MTAAKQSRLLTGKAPRNETHKGHQCAVEGCLRTTRAMSRYCYKHAQQYFRTRNPEGRMPRRKELIPYREIAEFALEAYGIEDHPAWIQACQLLEEWIARPRSAPSQFSKHLRRLNEGGATGRAMLLELLSVYGLSYVGLNIGGDPRAFGVRDDAVFFCCLGSRFLRTVNLGWYMTRSGKRKQVELPGLTAEVFGRALADKVGVFALSFWRKVESEDSWRTMPVKSLRKTLEEQPL